MTVKLSTLSQASRLKQDRDKLRSDLEVIGSANWQGCETITVGALCAFKSLALVAISKDVFVRALTISLSLVEAEIAKLGVDVDA